MGRKRSTPEHFWSRVAVTESGCWEFIGCRDRAGYGDMSFESKRMRAHRVAYTLAHGPIPPGLFVMHACDNPPCCNPDHLSVGTTQDNTADMVAKGRQKGAPRALGNGRGKLSDEDIEAIRKAHRGGETCASISRRLGLNDGYVSRIVRGVRRTHTANAAATS